MIISGVFCLLFGAIALDGVVGDQLSATASFDANNVRVGDPLILTVDFTGSADFASLHPPELSRAVDASVWKVDDESARTETWEGCARRLVYRVRPLKPGLHRFPSLDFTYVGRGGASDVSVASTPSIPVHVRRGAQVALSGVYDGGEAMPMPDGIVIGSPASLREGELFDWRRACANPTADAFAKFDIPEARLNEAACAVVEGNWARALKVYSALEWRIGQTPAVERGIVAALARKTGDAAAELPVWRQVLRPLLRHAWPGRVGLAAGVLAAVVIVFWLSGRAIRMLALFALVFAPFAGAAQDPFEMMERQMRQMFDAMGGFGAPGALSVNGVRQPPVEVRAYLRMDRADVRQGEPFHYILALEVPKTTSIEQVNVRPSEMFGLVLLANSFENLADGASSNPSNVVKRMQIPVRYDVPFHGTVTFDVSGMASSRTTSNGGRSSFSFSQSFNVRSSALDVEVKPLPTEGQPPDFTGAIGGRFRLTRSVIPAAAETNDVLVVVNTLQYDGFVPPELAPDLVERRPGRISWREYFVADGAPVVPEKSLVYYDTGSRTYRRAKAPPVRIAYVAPSDEAASATVAVDAAESDAAAGALKLRFAPRSEAPVVAVSTGPHTVTETRGTWARIDDGRHAGWVRKEDLR